MNVPEVKDRLVEAGLLPLEADVYLRLLLQGPSRASEIAAGLGKARSESYRTLDRLTQRGVLLASVARPVSYSAVAPERVLRLLLFRRQEELERVRRLGEELLPVLGTLSKRAVAEDPPSSSLRVVQGRERILRDISHAILRSARRVDLYLGAPDSLQGWSRSGLALQVLDRAREGSAVRALLHPDAEVPEWGAARWIRATPLPFPGEFVRIEGGDAFVWLRSGGRSSSSGRKLESALVTDAPDLAALLAAVFEAGWKAAT